MDPLEQFVLEKKTRIAAMRNDGPLRQLSNDWMLASARHNYTYNFTWLGVPIIQFPQDIVAMQELIWRVQPDLIVETGIAHGGSLIFSASMLRLIGGDGLVIGVDIDMRAHNRAEIERHPLARCIRIIEGSSVDEAVAEQVRALARGRKRVLVALDSDHTHAHVLRELQLYSSLVTKGSYLVVFDTSIEDAPADFFRDRPWGKGNNPKTAVHEFLKTNDRFRIDHDIDAKLQITVAPDGWLECVKE